MTAQLKLPTVLTGNNLRNINDLPFKKDSLIAWVTGEQYLVSSTGLRMDALIDASSGFEYMKNGLSPSYIIRKIGGRPFMQGWRGTGESSGTAGYTIPVDRLASATKFTMAAVFCADSLTDIAPTSPGQMFTCYDHSDATKTLLSLEYVTGPGYVTGGAARVVIRRSGISDTPHVVTKELPDLAAFTYIIAEVDYANNMFSLDVGGSISTGPIIVAGEGLGWNGSPTLVCELGGIRGTAGTTSDTVVLSDILTGASRAELASYLRYRAASANTLL